ncbi:hypothetical protein LP417_35405 (plasmid) [Polaromonas sp. P1-6]|nr:hypothetical protein LP417_35405 [Polaromonas sp. P1-6]
MIEKLTKRGLQFAALVLGTKVARDSLLQFYVSRGLEETEAQALIANQARRVRLVIIPVGLVLMVLGMYLRNVVSSSDLGSLLSVMSYLGLFLLACQLAAGRSAASPWKSVKEMLKK